MEEKDSQSIRIRLDDPVANGEYVNFANIIHSPSEFVIDFGRAVPGRAEIRIHSRVIMTPLHAKQMLDALAQNVAIFEQKYGPIRTEPGIGSYSSPSGSDQSN
ncbi:MAG: DUF3467 domain-containing protein [Thermoanaerobaculia bacterium]